MEVVQGGRSSIQSFCFDGLLTVHGVYMDLCGSMRCKIFVGVVRECGMFAAALWLKAVYMSLLEP